jgi:hypothetical protein
MDDVDSGIAEILTNYYGRCVADAALAVQRRALALHLREQRESDDAVLVRLRPRVEMENDGLRDALHNTRCENAKLTAQMRQLRDERDTTKNALAAERGAAVALVDARRATYAAEQRVQALERELRASRLEVARVEHDRLVLVRTLAVLRAERAAAMADD